MFNLVVESGHNKVPSLQGASRRHVGVQLPIDQRGEGETLKSSDTFIHLCSSQISSVTSTCHVT